MALPTRSDYLDRRIAHHDYYASIAKEAGIDLSKHRDLPKWREAVASGNDFLNSTGANPEGTVPSLGIQYWDRLALAHSVGIDRALRLHEDTVTLSGRLCTIKAAARLAALGAKA